jgi:hypothetical protein
MAMMCVWLVMCSVKSQVPPNNSMQRTALRAAADVER